MVCQKCGTQIPRNSIFCPHCGTRVMPMEKKRVVDYITQELHNDVCAGCGAKLPPNVSFCGKCGSVRTQLGKQKRIPKCVRCSEPLLPSARFCIICKLEYLPSEDGYVEIPLLQQCTNCGEAAEEDVAFCTKCGQKLQQSAQPETELCLPVCPNCQTPYEADSQKCAGCGSSNLKFSKYPIIDGNTLTCPSCGEAKMPANRRVCWKCGLEWMSRPWYCHQCGKQNLHKTQNCYHCHAKRQ